MKRLRLVVLLAMLPGVGYGQPAHEHVNTSGQTEYVAAFDPALHLVEVAPGLVVATGQGVLDVRATEGERMAVLESNLNAFPSWAPGLEAQAGRYFVYQDVLYRCLQSHTTQEDWAPPRVPALFEVEPVRVGDAVLWQPGTPIERGEKVRHSGVLYRCLQTHTTQAGWEPPNVPALFKEIVIPPLANEWAPGVSYSVGDEVTYESTAYRCLQAHTSLVGWEPPRVPALWEAL